MAAPFVKLRNFVSFQNLRRNFIIGFSKSYKHINRRPWVIVGSSIAGATTAVAFLKPVYAKQSQKGHPGEVEAHENLSSREMRFNRFASVEHDGHIYMTPQDFLESLIEEDPRPRIGRTKVDEDDLHRMLKKTPRRRNGSSELFREMHDQGIISYTEYLFLLTVLTKPQSGFRIAFNMFDTDGNERVDKNEFLVIRDLLSGWRRRQRKQEDNEKKVNGVNFLHAHLERIFMEKSVANQDSQDAKDETKKMATIWEVSLAKDEKEGPTDTTLLVHLFGAYGEDQLKYEDFFQFMSNLQTEVLELEFDEFSRGMKTISEEDFAKILLRYTLIHSQDQEEYIERLRSRMPVERGITFEEFRQFCMFLNNLDDFIIAMKIYTISDKPVSQEEFRRAVMISTGCELNAHLVHTVFQIFDKDGDGSLSYREFIAIMKDRLHRGFRAHLVRQEGWEAFKTCVKNRLRQQYA